MNQAGTEERGVISERCGDQAAVRTLTSNQARRPSLPRARPSESFVTKIHYFYSRILLNTCPSHTKLSCVRFNLNCEVVLPPKHVLVNDRHTWGYRHVFQVGISANREVCEPCRPFDTAQKTVAGRIRPKI